MGQLTPRPMTVVIPDPPRPSHALWRIRFALMQYAPWGEVRCLPASHPEAADADLWVLFVVGQRDSVTREAQRIRATGARVAAIQVVYASSRWHTAEDWADLWAACDVVWSTYRLPTDKLYHAPFGVSYDLYPHAAVGPRPWWVMTTGPGWLQEGVREVQLAAQAANRPAWHLGPTLGRRRGQLARVARVGDIELSGLYAATRYVSGLRRIEGFELPCAEGLCNGARPILYDQPHYTDWYGESAVYLPERSRGEVEAAVTEVFHQPPRTVSRTEMVAAQQRFAWGPIVAGFWEWVR